MKISLFQILLANFLAQPEALMRGKSPDEAKAELTKSGMPEDQIAKILPHKVCTGTCLDFKTRQLNFCRFSKEIGRQIVSYFRKLRHSLWAR